MPDDDHWSGFNPDLEITPDMQEVRDRYRSACTTLVRKAYPRMEGGSSEPVSETDILNYLSAKIDMGLIEAGVTQIKATKNDMDTHIRRLVVLRETLPEFPGLAEQINALSAANQQIRALDEARSGNMPQILRDLLINDIELHEDKTAKADHKIEFLDNLIKLEHLGIDDVIWQEHSQSVANSRFHSGMSRSLRESFSLFAFRATDEPGVVRYTEQEKKSLSESYDEERKRLMEKSDRGEPITQQDIYDHLRSFVALYVTAFPKDEWGLPFYEHELEKSIKQGLITDEIRRIYQEAMHFNDPEATGRKKDANLSRKVLVVLQEGLKLFAPPSESN